MGMIQKSRWSLLRRSPPVVLDGAQKTLRQTANCEARRKRKLTWATPPHPSKVSQQSEERNIMSIRMCSREDTSEDNYSSLSQLP